LAAKDRATCRPDAAIAPERIAGGASRETGGTGMGLEIVRSMLRAHRGSIRLAAADHGVAFVLTFPAA
jgi:signal transduction histidine kinase